MVDENRIHYVYRVFGAEDELLYVGCTVNPEQRFSLHRSQFGTKVGSHWVGRAERVTVHQYPTRTVALAAEVKAIQTENPTYNKMRYDGVPLLPWDGTIQ